MREGKLLTGIGHGIHCLTSQPYSSHVFTINDLVLFSYEDGTQLELYDPNEDPVSFSPNVLNKGQHVYVNTSSGVYLAAGSKRFTVLSGDAATPDGLGETLSASGYYAMDASGQAVSREFYTYAPSLYGTTNDCKFIVFAYEGTKNMTNKPNLKINKTTLTPFVL